MWRNFRRFRNHRCINIYGARFFFREQHGNLLQDLDTADVANRFVRVWKMLTDVAGADRTEESVRNCVRQNVSIGVSFEPEQIGNFNPAEDQLSIFGRDDARRNRFQIESF